MNRRQKKKAYKKKYGHNPPTGSYIYQAYGIDMQSVAEAMGNGIRMACEAIVAFTKNITSAWESMKEHIQTMTEEEYAEFVEELTPEQKGWAELIRMGAKRK